MRLVTNLFPVDYVPNTWKVRENVYKLWILAVWLSFFYSFNVSYGQE